MSFETLINALNTQREFSNLFFDPESLTEKEKEEITKTFVLSLHTAASDLVSAVNYKDHRQTHHEVDHAKIVYKSVDVFRYMLATLNLWQINPEDFVDACEAKDNFLHMRHTHEGKKRREQQKVVVFDCDDVIAGFRETFNSWLASERGVNVDPESKEYYNTVGVKEAGFEPEAVFRDFISSSGFRKLPVDPKVAEVMNMLRQKGYWIQILTARPSDNLRCYYDTYWWLKMNNIPFDSIGFSGEKFRWLSDQDYYSEGAVVCAIDDSPKHAAELAKHGIRVIVPALPYNEEVGGKENVTRVDFNNCTTEDLSDIIEGAIQ
tara:strand:- start:167 stop:1126 length:960 start_codon:yes stop_codon:yes gene_type:complete